MMTRKLLCGQCAFGYSHPTKKMAAAMAEDAADGWRQRLVKLAVRKPKHHGLTVNGQFHPLDSLMCDNCGLPLADGTQAEALTCWKDIPEPPMWEEEYL